MDDHATGELERIDASVERVLTGKARRDANLELGKFTHETASAAGRAKKGKKHWHLSHADLEALHVVPTFDGQWAAFYDKIRRQLLRRYAPVETQAPQYAILCSRLARLYVAAHIFDAERKPLNLALEARIRDLVAQLQRYTEAERSIELRVSTAEDQLVTRFVRVAQHLLPNTPEKLALFAAWDRVVAGESLEAVTASLTPSSSLPVLGEVIDHHPGENG